MAAIKLKENMDFDLKATYEHVKSSLPSYARPRFIRIQVGGLTFSLWSKKSQTSSIRKSWLFLLLAGRSGGNGDV